MGDSCYVMSEDISAPAHMPGEPLRVPKLDLMAGTTTTNEVPYSRNNYVTFTPAYSFETFLVQPGGAWTAIKQPLSGVVVVGFEYAISFMNTGPHNSNKLGCIGCILKTAWYMAFRSNKIESRISASVASLEED
ncbi:hypothetical protein FRC03_003618 [Tulasnella sp. 419]|nr:hypothetical protein FRC02_003437 [Tulasnella sp. 418]KAG8942136.1 hypothetical protein FRC03_003618 [Tulasnella sp. 419]